MESIGYVAPAVLDFEHFALEAPSVTLLALNGHIGEKLHLYGDSSLSLACLATATFGVE